MYRNHAEASAASEGSFKETVVKLKSLLLSHSTISIDSSWTLKEVKSFFENMDVSYLSIISAEQFAGIISKDEFLDYIKKYQLSERELCTTSAIAALSARNDFCESEENIDRAWSFMNEKGLKYVGVKSYDKVVGVVSYSALAAVVSGR